MFQDLLPVCSPEVRERAAFSDVAEEIWPFLVRVSASYSTQSTINLQFSSAQSFSKEKAAHLPPA